MMDHNELILARSILESQSDGVIALDFDGSILLFNAAAAAMLGVNRDDALRCRFADVFIATERLDEFNQVIIDAVSNRSIDERRAVAIHCGEKARYLSVSASYLVRAGSAERLGVIASFSDITEMEEMRKAEARMAQSLKDQNTELQGAYRKIEENNAALETAMKKAQIARIAVTGFIIALFVALGAYGWVIGGLDDGDGAADIAGAGASLPDAAQAAGALRTFTVRPKPLTSSISLAGRLTPWRKAAVTSPVAGKVTAVHFQYGQAVEKGDLLVEFDISELRREHRDARRSYLTALKEFRSLEDWESSPEMSAVRRSFAKAEAALKDQKRELDITAKLLEEGVIPANQHKAAQKQYFNLELDYEAARQELELMRVKNNEENRQVAQLALDNAREAEHELAESLRRAYVRAPISGVVLEAGAQAAIGGGASKNAVEGQSVREGDLLLTIGDLRRMAAVTSTDELFVSRIEAGQKVRATGDGFPGLVLEGEIARVSSEARAGGTSAGSLPAFEIVAVFQELASALRGRLRLGMSVDVEVITYSNPAALMVPLAAVTMRRNEPWLRVKDRETAEIRDTPVETGATTAVSVEVLRGVRPGDEIVLGPRS